MAVVEVGLPKWVTGDLGFSARCRGAAILRRWGGAGCSLRKSSDPISKNTWVGGEGPSHKKRWTS